MLFDFEVLEDKVGGYSDVGAVEEVLGRLDFESDVGHNFNLSHKTLCRA
jgi:hypothetical protein